MAERKIAQDIQAERLEYIYEVALKLDKAFFPIAKAKAKPKKMELVEQIRADIFRSAFLKRE